MELLPPPIATMLINCKIHPEESSDIISSTWCVALM